MSAPKGYIGVVITTFPCHGFTNKPECRLVLVDFPFLQAQANARMSQRGWKLYSGRPAYLIRQAARYVL